MEPKVQRLERQLQQALDWLEDDHDIMRDCVKDLDSALYSLEALRDRQRTDGAINSIKRVRSLLRQLTEGDQQD